MHRDVPIGGTDEPRPRFRFHERRVRQQLAIQSDA
jgi:hypothetical protein